MSICGDVLSSYPAQTGTVTKWQVIIIHMTRSSAILGVLVTSVLIACLSGLGTARADQVAEARFAAHDTLKTARDDDPQVQAILDGMAWEPGEFEVRCTSTPGLAYDALVRFDSPFPSGDQWVDKVVLAWYAARDEDGQVIEAPAVLVVHSLHPKMVVADQIARVFAGQGLHTFVIHLPGYGLRTVNPGGGQGGDPSGDRRIRLRADPGNSGINPGVTALEHGRQAVADCRRARDAIAALPNIKPGPIALQGTSLGGFVAATAGALDGAFDPVVLLISGADGYRTLQEGLHDAMFLRIALEKRGYTGQTLRKLLAPIEPLHVAHRLDPDRTWLISAKQDLTIPRFSSDALAEAIGLDDKHRLWLGTNHYTTLVVLPTITRRMSHIILGKEPGPVISPATAPTTRPHD